MSQKLEVKAYNATTGYLDVGDGHLLHWKQFGNLNGLPVLVLHGGPGCGMDEYLADYFDLSRTNVIMFDQRGAGQSTPSGELRNNTTSDLIDDCARVLHHFEIKSSVIVGGSWGATLAIEFAKKYPALCSRLIIYSTFLARPQDEKWFLNDARSIFPEYWQKLTNGFSDQEKENITRSFWDRLQKADASESRILTARFLSYMKRLLFLTVESETVIAPEEIKDADLKLLQVFLYYSINNYFMDNLGVLKEIQKLDRIPCDIIHGRYDMDSPLAGAYDMSRLLPTAKFHILPRCGHSDREPQMRDFLTRLFNSL